MPSRILDLHEEEDDEIIRSSQRSSPAGSESTPSRPPDREDTPSESQSDSTDTADSAVPRRRNQNGSSSSNRRSQDEKPDRFQPGAIRRVTLKNFITYSATEFIPGPNLNMIIGPNGTGKSSLVCAICLGLGGSPLVLGRAGKIGEFVKHECDTAVVEIELEGTTGDPNDNPVIRLKIMKESNSRDWYLNGKKSSHNAVQQLMKSFSIKIDNLCQFLPQDKVSAFAEMTPVKLLEETQQATAPPQMLEWHEELKKHREQQKTLEADLEQDRDVLRNVENRQEGLRAEVERLEEINEIKNTISMMEKTVPMIEYKADRLLYKELDDKTKRAKQSMAKLEADVAPTVETRKQKEAYLRQIGLVVDQRKVAVKTAEKQAEHAIKEIEKASDKIKEFDTADAATMTSIRTISTKITDTQRKIKSLEARYAEQPEPFDAQFWNKKIGEKEREHRTKVQEKKNLEAQYDVLKKEGVRIRREQDSWRIELGALNSQEGQQLSRVENLSKDSATAWKWIQEHRDEFEQEVYGPPLVTCAIIDPRYAAAVEGFLNKQDLLAFTAQTQADYLKLQNHLLGKAGLNLADVSIRSINKPLAQMKAPPMSKQDMQKCGLEGWAVDYIDGPDAVLAMLCDNKRIQGCGITLRDISEEQHNMLVSSRTMSAWITGKHFYKVNRRAEYGPGATSTMSRSVNDAKFWVDTPVDTSRKLEVEAKIEELQKAYDAIAPGAGDIRSKIVGLNPQIKTLMDDAAIVKKEKDAKQSIYSAWNSIPADIEQENQSLEAKLKAKQEYLNNIKNTRNLHDNAVLAKAEKVLEHKSLVEAIRNCHKDLVDALIMQIEASSDIESLKARNSEIERKLERGRAFVEDASRKSAEAKARARISHDATLEIQAVADAAGYLETLKAMIPDGTTAAMRRDEIAAEQEKLSLIHAGNPNAIRDFQRFKAQGESVQEKITNAEAELKDLNTKIADVRGQWEPQLDRLVSKISDAFSDNFEKIGCAGEVGIHKDEEFASWAIQIKVKFRAGETLQILDSHRQSGGERSVSTIFYLMSLQSLARSPFRVVDEINQGMDPRNERMVHERMVDIACKEHTSQYFLITPKLLTGLRYDKRMKVHCIASGEFMPKDYKRLDVRKIINIRRAAIASG